MIDSAMYSPNNQHLSDQVFRDVLVRVRHQSHRPSTIAASASLTPNRSAPTATTADSATTFAAPRLHDGEANEESTRRERNKLHQQRYRMNQRNQLHHLEGTIEELNGEIHELELRRQLVYWCGLPSKSKWSVAAEYFRLFRFGVQVPVLLETQCPIDARVQTDFLRSAMVEDVTDGHVVGIEELMESWRQMSLYYSGMNIQLVRLENGPGHAVVATTTQVTTIDERMMRLAFPNLIRGEDNEARELVGKLLGQKFEVHGSVHFEWLPEGNRVKSFQFRADMVTRLLGTLEKVARVFDNARLTPECGLVF